MEDEFLRAARFINGHKWTFASTMKDIPHYYVVRDRCSDKDEFNWFDGFIHREGEVGYFGRRAYRYLYLNGYKYWDCGDQTSIENLINRDRYPCDFMDSQPDENNDLFAELERNEENAEIMEVLRGVPFSSVYNPSCGAGRMHDILTSVNPECAGKYIGSDTRHSRLTRFNEERRPFRLYKDKAGHLWFGQMDLVVTLEAERLNSYALRRIRHMVNGGGTALLFSKERINFFELNKYGVAGNWRTERLKNWHLLSNG